MVFPDSVTVVVAQGVELFDDHHGIISLLDVDSFGSIVCVI
jgi:hypothetical protein